jgi:CheY-like chemotaxis protein
MSDFDEENAARAASGGATRKTKKRPSIFYVDDNPRALRVLTSVLEGCGYKVIAASTARGALESMEQNRFDLILLAYRLPRVIGFKVARDLKRRSPGTPVILISGYNLWEPEELTYVDAYVGKGASLDSLLTKIRALIGRT